MSIMSFRILLVEDDPGHAALVLRSLRRSGQFQVHHVIAIREAYRYLQTNHIDLMISDERLPDGEGQCFLQNNTVPDGFPVIVLIAQDYEEMVPQMIRTGAMDCVLKTKECLLTMGDIAERAIRHWSDLVLKERAQQALRDSEWRFRTLAEFTSDWIYWEDMDGKIVYVSPSCKEITGYSPKKFQANPNLLSEMIFPEDRITWQEHRHQTSHCDVGERLSFRICTKDGRICWIEHACRPITGQEGEFLGYRVCNRDITARMEAEKKLRAEHDFNTAILDTLKSIVIVLDDQGRFVQCNKYCEIISGYTAQELNGKSLLDLMIPLEERGFVEKRFQTLIEGYQEVDGENQWISKMGKRRLIYWSNSVLRRPDGTVEYIIGTGMDITEIRLSEELQQQIFRYAPDIMAIVNFDGSVRYVNPAVTSILGWPPEEFFNKQWVEYVHPEDRQRSLSIVNSLRSRQSSIKFEHRFRHQDGNYRWMSWTLIPIASNPKVFIAIGFDITNQLLSEEQQRRHEQEIMHASRLSQIGEMASSIAHELSQPLSAISATITAALEMVRASKNAIDPDMIEALHEANGQAIRAGDVIRRVRNFVRSWTLKSSTVNMNELIQESIAFIRKDLEIHTIRLEFQEQPEIPMVFVDPIQIQQVILNLIRNAMDAIEEENSTKREIRIGLLHENHQVIVSVSDTGTGIRPGLEEKIFDSFYTTKRKGLGLGLSLSRRIIENHGGKLRIQPNPESGVIFFFNLPVERREK
ncbi:MAG: PAS domain S-box protein [Sedimentisphaerales bacterium]|nr:PAS domain S-box protein [Sedimentisphaerales bacterium]